MDELSAEHFQVVEAALAHHAGVAGSLLPILQELQQAIGHIPAAAVPLLATALNLSRAEIHGVISFYHDLRSEAPGRHHIQLCRAEACQAVGARSLETHALARLGVAFGETRADGAFSLDAVYCLGNCACGPSVRIGDAVHGRVTPQRFDELLATLGTTQGAGS